MQATEYPNALSLSVDRDQVNSQVEGIDSRLKEFLSDQFTPIRLASHLAVLAVAAIVLIVSQIDLPDWQ
ncbi:hypothetical protein V6O07_13865, partial [Arthrospira platensis SPKY2]